MKKRGIVISNCQCQPLKHALSRFCADVSFEYLGVHLISPDRRTSEVANFVENALRSYDVIVSIPLSDDFGPISSKLIGETFADKFVARISNVFFSGLHPDLTYVGGLAERIDSPLGDYHSRIALLAYVSGLTRSHAQGLFSATTYEAMGYFDEYQRSLSELSDRDADVDVSIAPILPRLLGEELCFLSVNHPTSWLFAQYAELISRWLNEKDVTRFRPWRGGALGLMNYLASSAIFPIYPEIASKHGIDRLGSYIFQASTVGDTPADCFDLQEFIHESYAMYDRLGQSQLASSHQVQWMMDRYKNVFS